MTQGIREPLNNEESLSYMPIDSKSLHQSFKDYLELCKPKVVLLLLVTAVVGMYLSSHEPISLSLLLASLVGMGFAMSGAAAINHIVDHRIDLKMQRTQNRPLAKGSISNRNALIFALILCALSMIILDVFVNRLTMLLTLGGLLGYAVFYTYLLKRATPQNIVIGGLAGAIPPLLGWTAVTNELHPHALLLVLIVFLWTPPHFWALAIHRRTDYAKAQIPMLPVTHGVSFTKTQILLYTLLLLLASWFPFLTGMSGYIYLLSATALGCIFLYYALKLKWFADERTAMQTFGYSIIYLFLLFAALLLDHQIILG